MRPNQQNRRMRGRGNRKGPNPLTRSYESNGPDVKIRGSAQQVADKYTTLARDAQASGDYVMAENHLQHAEHYNRIIAAAQSQQQAQRESREEQQQDDSDAKEQSSVETDSTKAAQTSGEDGSGPQPVINGTPAEVALEEQAIPDGEANEGEKPAAKGPRRTRRPRRDAAKPTEQTTGEAKLASGEAEVPEDTDGDKTLEATGS